MFYWVLFVLLIWNFIVSFYVTNNKKFLPKYSSNAQLVTFAHVESSGEFLIARCASILSLKMMFKTLEAVLLIWKSTVSRRWNKLRRSIQWRKATVCKYIYAQVKTVLQQQKMVDISNLWRTNLSFILYCNLNVFITTNHQQIQFVSSISVTNINTVKYIFMHQILFAKYWILEVTNYTIYRWIIFIVLICVPNENSKSRYVMKNRNILWKNN